MRVLILAQNFPPESVGPGINYYQLGIDLIARGHQVTMLTAFPHYPEGFIFDGYRGKIFQREMLDGIEVIRTWIYATPSKSFWPRVVNFSSFSGSALLGGLIAARKFDVIYAVLPPLILGVTAIVQAAVRRTPVVVSIQDIYPHAAVVMGVLRNPKAIRFFERMEKWIYRQVDHIVVVSEGFRENLSSKGVPAKKMSVVSNWVDPDFIQPGPMNNSFRQELEVDGTFTLIYSGSLSHNSNLEPVLEAADLLRDQPVSFVIVGDGVHKRALEQLAAERKLNNLQFKPFQPLSRYGEVLRAADMTLVTLSNQAAFASVPSKIFKQMASGRPILAITAAGNEVDRLIKAAECGLCVPPDDPASLADALLWAQAHPEELNRMGQNGRLYLEEHHSRSKCAVQIEEILQQVLSQ